MKRLMLGALLVGLSGCAAIDDLYHFVDYWVVPARAAQPAGEKGP